MEEKKLEQTYAIELKNITKRFGKIVANDGINLQVKRGEILSLLGENGSGKTTLMNMISGIYFPDEGHIFVDGKEVSIRSPKDSFDLGIGMIHQHFKLIDVMTAAENIILGLKGSAVLDMKKVHKDIQELVDKYGFDLDPAQKVYTMSVSQKQTVEIVKMLYRGANILILDEPTAGLDPNERIRFRNLISELAEERLVLLSTHIVSDVEYIANEILLMKDGQLIHKGTVVDLINSMKEYVWVCHVEKNMVQNLSQKNKVSNIKSDVNGVELRIISKDKPVEKATRENATLEDVFLYYFGEKAGVNNGTI